MAEQIPLFNAPIQKPQVPSEGIRSLGTAALRVGRAGEEEARLGAQAGHALDQGLREVGAGFGEVSKQIQQHDESADIVGAHSALAAGMGPLTTQFNQYMQQNAGNPNAAQDFVNQYVTPFSQKLEDAAQTDRGRVAAATLGSQLTEHFIQLGAHTQAAVSGEKFTNDFNQAVTDWSARVYQNPGNLPMALNAIDGLHQQLLAANPGVNPETYNASYQKQRQEIIVGAAHATINQQLAQGKMPDISAITDRYGPEIGAPVMQQLTTYQQQQIRLFNEQNRINDQLQRQKDADAFHGSLNQAFAGMIQPDGTLRASPDMAKLINQWSDPRQTPGAQEGNGPNEIRSFVQLNRAIAANPEGAHDNATYADFSQRLALSPGDKNFLTAQQIADARTNGKLTNTEYSYFLGQQERARSGERAVESKLEETNLAAAKTAIMQPTAMNPFGSGQGAIAYSHFVNDTLPTVQGLIASGMSPNQAWASVMTPEKLAPYQREAMQASTTPPLGMAAPPGAQPAAPPATEKPDLNTFFKNFFK